MCVKGRWPGARAVWRVGLSGPVSLARQTQLLASHSRLAGWLAASLGRSSYRICFQSRPTASSGGGGVSGLLPTLPCPGSC